MRIWGTGAFDNDAATAWADEFDRVVSVARSVVARSALSAALDRRDPDTACAALAAATTVTAALPGGRLLAPNCGPKPQSISGFQVSPDLPELALAALGQIASPAGGWSRMWDRPDRLDDALAVLDAVTDELRERSASRHLRVHAAS